jgi:hypothetical protein
VTDNQRFHLSRSSVSLVARDSATERLDEEKLTLLRRWGEGLTLDEREEMRAAGRAILLLSDEIERLHIDLWHAGDRHGDLGQQAAEALEESPTPEQEPESPPDVGLGVTLRERLAMFRPSKATDR